MILQWSLDFKEFNVITIVYLQKNMSSNANGYTMVPFVTGKKSEL